MISEFEESYDGVADLQADMLETPVGDLMAKDPLIVDADATVVSAVNTMNERHTGCVLVQQAGKLVGIFTERDVLRKVIFRDGNCGWKVNSVMTRNPETLSPSASVAYALNKMAVDGYRHIPIVDKAGKPIGVLSVKDIVHYVVDSFPDGVHNLPPDPEKAIPKNTDGG